MVRGEALDVLDEIAQGAPVVCRPGERELDGLNDELPTSFVARRAVPTGVVAPARFVAVVPDPRTRRELVDADGPS